MAKTRSLKATLSRVRILMHSKRERENKRHWTPEFTIICNWLYLVGRASARERERKNSSGHTKLQDYHPSSGIKIIRADDNAVVETFANLVTIFGHVVWLGRFCRARWIMGTLRYVFTFLGKRGIGWVSTTASKSWMYLYVVVHCSQFFIYFAQHPVSSQYSQQESHNGHPTHHPSIHPSIGRSIRICKVQLHHHRHFISANTQSVSILAATKLVLHNNPVRTEEKKKRICLWLVSCK